MAPGMWRNAVLEGAWVGHWPQLIGNGEVSPLLLMTLLFLVLAKGRMSPRKLGKLGSGNLQDCLPQ